jgi:uncharacterized membrane protein
MTRRKRTAGGRLRSQRTTPLRTQTHPQKVPEERPPLDTRIERTSSYFEAKMSYSSPLPPPSMLAVYNDIVPNGAERIMCMAENQQDHRIELEKHVIFGGERRSNIALYIEGAVVAIALICGTFLVAIGRDGVGLVTTFTPLLLAAGFHVYGRQKKDQEVKELREQSMSASAKTSERDLVTVNQGRAGNASRGREPVRPSAKRQVPHDR